VAVTAVGTVLADLTLPLALIQLGALRQDRLRAQVSKVGAWIGTVEQMDEKTGSWTIPVLIRNGSELPVRVDSVDVAARARRLLELRPPVPPGAVPTALDRA